MTDLSTGRLLNCTRALSFSRQSEQWDLVIILLQFVGLTTPPSENHQIIIPRPSTARDDSTGGVIRDRFFDQQITKKFSR